MVPVVPMAPGRRRSTVARVAGELAEALLPQRCLVCGRFGAALHEHCLDGLDRAAARRCEACWAPVSHDPGLCGRCEQASPSFDALRTPLRFTGDARRALLEAKFRGVTRLIDPLAALAARAVPLHWQIDAVVPVPLHRSRQRERGYNQAEIAAQVVARDLELPLDPSLLRRERRTPAEAHLDAAGRARNLRGAFAVDGPPPPAVMVVDDITTTGSTFEEAANTLRAAGAATVYALALARED
jgi:ComF family protein